MRDADRSSPSDRASRCRRAKNTSPTAEFDADFVAARRHHELSSRRSLERAQPTILLFAPAARRRRSARHKALCTTSTACRPGRDIFEHEAAPSMPRRRAARRINLSASSPRRRPAIGRLHAQQKPPGRPGAAARRARRARHRFSRTRARAAQDLARQRERPSAARLRDDVALLGSRLLLYTSGAPAARSSSMTDWHRAPAQRARRAVRVGDARREQQRARSTTDENETPSTTETRASARTRLYARVGAGDDEATAEQR